MNIIYRIQTATLEDIYSHLYSCDNGYQPPLSSRVDLSQYSEKLFKRALSFEAWDENLLIGMINAYFNDYNTRISFISNVSVLQEYRRQGIASKLLQMCLAYASQRNFLCIKLEASSKNSSALEVYKKAGFKVVQACGSCLLMICEVTN